MLCTRCKKREALPDRKRCEDCRWWGAKMQREAAEKRIKKGLCSRCTKPALPGIRTCAKHRLSDNDWAAKTHRKKCLSKTARK